MTDKTARATATAETLRDQAALAALSGLLALPRFCESRLATVEGIGQIVWTAWCIADTFVTLREQK